MSLLNFNSIVNDGEFSNNGEFSNRNLLSGSGIFKGNALTIDGGFFIPEGFIVDTDFNLSGEGTLELSNPIAGGSLLNVTRNATLSDGEINFGSFFSLNNSSSGTFTLIDVIEGALNIDDAVLAEAIAEVDDKFDVDGVKDYTLQIQGNDLVLTVEDVDGGNNQNSSKINGTRGDDNLRGTNANEFITGNNGNDTLKGGQGNDTIEGGRGGDDISGGAGDDVLAADRIDRFDDFDGSTSFLGGDNGNDTIFGGRKNDTIGGGNGSDVLYGKRGNDLIRGGGGDDLLNGGLGNDTLRGQGGNDTADYCNLTFNGVFGTVAGLDINLARNNALHSSNNNALTWTDTINTIENVTGTQRNDRFVGNSQNNVFDGQKQVGRDNRQTVFTSQNGEDYQVTADVVEYSSSQSGFSFNGSADNFTVSGNGEGTDTLIDIEFIRFNADSSVVATSDLNFS